MENLHKPSQQANLTTLCCFQQFFNEQGGFLDHLTTLNYESLGKLQFKSGFLNPDIVIYDIT